MYTRRRFLCAGSAVSLTAVAGIELASGGQTPEAPVPAEPTYRGHPASFWLDRLLCISAERDKDFDDRVGPHETRHALAAFGEPIVPLLMEVLQFGSESEQLGVVDALALMGDIGEGRLTAAAWHTSAGVRARALARLAMEFPNASHLLGMLAGGLNDPDAGVRLTVVAVLWQAGDDKRAILKNALEHWDPAVRRRAVTTVMLIDSRQEFADPLLLPLLADPEPEVRFEAAENLFEYGRTNGQVINVLAEFARQGNRRAANALPFAGPAGLQAAITLLNHTDVSVRAAVAVALADFSAHRDSLQRLSGGQTRSLQLACRGAAQDNDLAVSEPAKQVLVGLQFGT